MFNGVKSPPWYDKFKVKGGFALPEGCDECSLGRLDFGVNIWKCIGERNFDICSIYAYDQEGDLIEKVNGGYEENQWLSVPLKKGEVVVSAQVMPY